MPGQDRDPETMEDAAQKPRKVFRVPRRPRFLAKFRIVIFSLLFAVVICIPLFVAEPRDTRAAWGVCAFYSLVLVLLVVDAIVDARRYTQVVEIDAQGIAVSRPGGRRTTMAWREIDRVSNCPASGRVDLFDKRNRRVRIEYKLRGLHRIMQALYYRWFADLPPCIARCESTSLFRFIWSAHVLMALLAYVTSYLSLILIFPRWRLDVRLHDDRLEIKHLLFFSRRYRYRDIVRITLRSRRGPAVALRLRGGRTVWLRYIREGELGLYNSLRQFWSRARTRTRGASHAPAGPAAG
ncbi:MAG: hypothetical protein ACYSU0_21405 [Planctomycetota bacterium]